MRKLRTGNDRQEMVVAGISSTWDAINLLYRDIRLKLQATRLLEVGKGEQREQKEEPSAPSGSA